MQTRLRLSALYSQLPTALSRSVLRVDQIGRLFLYAYRGISVCSAPMLGSPSETTLPCQTDLATRRSRRGAAPRSTAGHRRDDCTQRQEAMAYRMSKPTPLSRTKK